MELKIFKNNYAELWDNKNLIATTKDDNLPNIDFNGIEFEGYVDVEELADLWSINTSNVHPVNSYIAKQGYIEGFKTAQSLNDKSCTCQQKIFNVEIQSEENVIKVVKILRLYINNITDLTNLVGILKNNINEK